VCRWRSGDGSGAFRDDFVGEETAYCNHREVLSSKNLNPVLPETFTGATRVIYVNQKIDH
jgi:hypothetical protein